MMHGARCATADRRFERPKHPQALSQTRFHNIDGRLLWTSFAAQQRPRQVGDLMSHDQVKLRVVGVARVDTVQHVNVELAPNRCDRPQTVRAARERRQTVGNVAALPAIRVPRALLDELVAEADRLFEPLSAVLRRALRDAMQRP